MMKIKRLIYITLFTTLICVFTVVIPKINIPFIDVPVTLQTMMVMLAGFFLNPIDAFLSMVLYIILGLIGLPVFSGLNSGIGALLGPTGGFILSFPLAALLISLFKGQKSFIQLVIISIVFGVFLVYLSGALSISILSKASYLKVLKTLLVFIPLDIFKVIFAVLVYDRLKEFNIYQ